MEPTFRHSPMIFYNRQQRMPSKREFFSTNHFRAISFSFSTSVLHVEKALFLAWQILHDLPRKFLWGFTSSFHTILGISAAAVPQMLYPRCVATSHRVVDSSDRPVHEISFCRSFSSDLFSFSRQFLHVEKAFFNA